MLELIDIWKMLAGVAIFLLGIKFLEESLQELAGRRFKLFLKKQTQNKVKAIGGGAIVTAVLQSSSVVGLMVLGGVQLVMIGVLGEYIGKILAEQKARPIYFIAEHSVKAAESEAGATRTAAE